MPIPMSKNGAARPYTINMVGESDAEINLYGEVVECYPIDMWTGEKIPGNFIALDEFLKDIDELGTKENITVHINSVGGSLYAGLAIYNRLKSLNANVITVNDALAASAASIIFMAGNTRKMNAGSSLMIHEAAHMAWGYYRVKDHEADIKQLQAHNKTAVAVYAERTGNNPEEIKLQLKAETWMTGQEAVDAGFADEVIGSEGEVTMSLSPDKRFIVSNGVAMSTNGMSIMPAAAAVMTDEQLAQFIEAKQSVSPAMRDTNITQNKKTGGKNMNRKAKRTLQNGCPIVVNEVEHEEWEEEQDVEFEENEEEIEEEVTNEETEEETEEKPEEEVTDEETASVCPVCGEECETLYSRDEEVFGCEFCVTVTNTNGTTESRHAKNSVAAGIKQERNRIRAIEAIEAAIGDKQLVKAAKFGKNPLTAEQLALKAMQAQAAIGNTVLTNMAKDAKSSNAGKVVGAPTNIEHKTAAEKDSAIANAIAGFRPKK